jgi:O-antigen/teichoic acid export membrane protein
MRLTRYFSRLSMASISPVFEFALRFVRTIVLARILSPTDLGAAVALMSILAGCEMITDVGLDKFVVVTRGETRAQAVATARQLALVRAIVLAVAIYVAAPLLAAAFGAGDHSGSIAWLGLVPLIASFKNWRMIQIEQDYRYGPEAAANVGGQVAALIAIFPAAAWFRDERAVLTSLVVEAIVHVALSHALVKREPVTARDPAMRRAALVFGLPLMLNGLGLIAVKQLDQVVVANLFNLPTLALYSLGLNLAIAPTSLLQSIAYKISLPMLGRSRGDKAISCQISLAVILGMAFMAAVYALPLGVALYTLVPLLYGPAYPVTEGFCALAMFLAFLRFCRGGPNMILLELGLTGRLTKANMVAVIGVPIGLLLGFQSGRLEAVMVGFVIGDLASLIVLMVYLNRHVPVSAAIPHLGLLTIAVGLPAAAMAADPASTLAARGLPLAVGGLMIVGDAIIVYRHILRSLVGRAPGVEQHLGAR